MPRGSPRPGPRPYRRVIRQCRRCGRDYWGRKHGYCSPECGEAARADHLEQSTITPQMLERLAESPLTRKGPAHHTALEWSLRSPDGITYHFRNLYDFLREHADLFAPEDVEERYRGGGSRASVGLGQLRPDRKMKRQPQSWKGWTWSGSDKINREKS